MHNQQQLFLFFEEALFKAVGVSSAAKQLFQAVV
jgi:hypothetical protein